MTTAHQEWRDKPGGMTFQEWCRERDRKEADRLDGKAGELLALAETWSTRADKAARAKDETTAGQCIEFAKAAREDAQVLKSKAAKLRECVP